MRAVAETTCGKLEGAEDHGGAVFRGIPFAQFFGKTWKA